MTTAAPTRIVDPLRQRALAVIREGRLIVSEAQMNTDLGNPRPRTAFVQVRSSRSSEIYAIDTLIRDDGTRSWDCTCRSHERCAHIAAAQLVLGGPQ